MEPIRIADEEESIRKLLNCKTWMALPLEADESVILVDMDGSDTESIGFVIDDDIMVYGKGFIVSKRYIVGQGYMCANFTGDRHFLKERIRFLTETETVRVRKALAPLISKEKQHKVEIAVHILSQITFQFNN